MRMSILIVSLAAALMPALALAGPGHGRDPELASLKRQMMAARLVHELKLSPEQRSSILGLVRRARALRASAEEDMAVKRAKAALKETLREAIDEVRRTGHPSPDTRVKIETIKDTLRDAHRARKDQFKAIMKALKETLTDDQLETLRELKQRHHGRMRRFPDRGGRKALKFLTSDEFLAELSR